MQPAELAHEILSFANTRNTGQMPLETGIDGLNLMIRSEPTNIEPALYHPIFCLVLQGEKQVEFGDRILTFGEMESLIVSMDLPSNGRVIKASHDIPYIGMAINIDMAMLRELSEQISADEVREEQAGTIATGSADTAILDAMARLFNLQSKTSARRVLEPLIKKEIHYHLLTAEHGSMLRALCKRDSHAARIEQAIAVIRREYNVTLKIDELARVAGMSVSTFHEHFKAFTAISPLQFQKQLRLLEARRLLRTGNHSVSSASYEVGYESRTQFSREYSRMYGISPVHEIRKK